MVYEYFLAVVYAEKNRFVPLPIQRLVLFQRQNVDVFYILNPNHGKCLNIALFLRPLRDDKSVIEVVLPAQQQHGVMGLQTLEVSFAVNSQQPYIGLVYSMRLLRLCVDVLKKDAANKQKNQTHGVYDWEVWGDEDLLCKKNQKIRHA